MLKRRPWGWFLLGIVIFGILMGVRQEFEAVWMRSLIAAVAFVSLFLCVVRFKKVRD